MSDAVTRFYLGQLPEGQLKNNTLHAPCPFCSGGQNGEKATLVVFLQPESYFHGYFRCLGRCPASGFPLHFSRLRGTSLTQVPGYDPDREYFGREVDYPVRNLNNELAGFADKLAVESAAHLLAAGLSLETLAELHVGHNGRYLVYPYFQPDDNCYAARCVHPDKPEDFFWYGDERFFADPYRVFNAPEIDRCENGTLFLVEGEENLLCLRQLGLPGVALPAAADLEHLDAQRFSWIRTLFLWVSHNAESAALARAFATRAGFKVRIVCWPESTPRNATLHRLAIEGSERFQQTVFAMIREARAFSPFPSPAGEYHAFTEQMAQEAGAAWGGLTTGFARLDRALGGIHGLNVLGGTPKAGKSSFCIQVASDMANRHLPVIYYDFENGRQKIYLRILSRLSRLPVERIRAGSLVGDEAARLQQGLRTLEAMLPWLRVVNDRKLSPETMRRHIDFLRRETRSDYVVVVIDSLHKLPFKDISQKRSGIDGWLRQLEAIRDELAVSFLVISELERGQDGQFDRQPQLGSFKGSGDIGYSADNAMVLLPQGEPFADGPPEERANDLWLVASREQSPGRVAGYRLDFPFWGFIEV
ncbi:MAG: bifunctional DNA primase/helicase [Desulfobulbus sp.]|jgi:replicative DNA helicase|nr:bifunctional DNA primase/helicase [Desulfobulbus sp.]